MPMIPRIIHQVWLGGSDLPPLAKKWRTQLQRLLPEWEHRLWTEKTINYLTGLYSLASCKSQSSRANVVRLNAIATYGGIYLDCDCEVLKPLDNLLQYQAFAAFELPNRICNAVFGAVPRHPWIQWQLDNLPAFIGTLPPWGPELMSVAPRVDLTIVPTECFYPFLWDAPTQQRNAHPRSYLIHHWSRTWKLPTILGAPGTAYHGSQSSTLPKVAVITPTWKTPPAWLEQCVRSVAEQTVKCTHFIVHEGDGDLQVALPPGTHLLRTSGPHGDVGNAARAIGAISAISRGFNAIAFLDADNWYEPNHLELLLEAQRHTRAAVCSSTRNLVDLNGSLLGLCPEIDGETFVDTNCLLLTPPAFALLPLWYQIPSSTAKFGDRIFWTGVLKARLAHFHVERPTVNYRTNYKSHYEFFGHVPPAAAKKTIEVMGL